MMRTGALAEISYGIESTSRARDRLSDLATECVHSISDPAWDRLVLSHPGHNIFQTTAWARVLSETYGHQPFYLSISRGAEPVALIPFMEIRSPITGRRGVCLPFSDMCEPLIFDSVSVGLVRDRIVRFARERHWKYCEIRGGQLLPAGALPAVKFYAHSVDLRGGIEELGKRFSSSARRAIRKGQRSELTIQISQTLEGVLEFYRLHTRTRRRHGLPPQPISFFQKIHEHIIAPDLGFVVLARSGSSPVAGALFFRLGKRAVYKFGASDERFQDLRGNNLVMWEGIQNLVKNGVETLHLGRTSLGNDGLRRFKLSWATEEETIEYSRFDAMSERWVAGRDNATGFHNVIFSKLPLPLNRMIGAVVYPHLD